ncbi:response regulator transcription factor [uncultured Abyssibacter sp.]|uniref:response regulator transcription factor n=1 Tax=uncultured Abyssibacter sp. TaxID=2320202 RepID=UPI0032B164FB
MRVLVVDDDPSLREGVAALITEAGFDVDTADGADAADSWVRAVSFAAIVLDLGLPDGDGLDLIRQWRRRGATLPILVLSARGTPDERADGLEAGANDYLPKPFHGRELLARLRRMIQGTSPLAEPLRLRPDGQVGFDLVDESVFLDGQPVALSRTLRRVLGVLVAARGRAVSKARLMDQVRDLEAAASDNAVEQWVRRLRQQLGAGLIVTVPGQGYAVCLPLRDTAG